MNAPVGAKKSKSPIIGVIEERGQSVLGWLFRDLIADGHAMASLQQLMQVSLQGFMRKARPRNLFTSVRVRCCCNVNAEKAASNLSIVTI